MATVIDMSSAKYLSGEYALNVIGYYPESEYPAIELVHSSGDRGENVVITTNLGGYGVYPPEGHVFIKNYSENEGVLKPLVDAGILEIVDSIQPHGSFVAFPLCKVLVDLNAL